MLCNGGILALAAGDVNRERPVLNRDRDQEPLQINCGQSRAPNLVLGRGRERGRRGYRIDEKRKAWGPGVATLDGFRQTG